MNGILIALSTPFFLGVAPIWGKLAIHAGADSFTVAALRTVIAALLLWVVYGLFFRRYLYIYPAGLLGCIVVGAVNGVGSLFYYGGLRYIDASMVQLVNGTYLIFAVLLSRLGGEEISRRVWLRVAISMAALFLLTGFADKPVNWLGVGLLLANALMFAGTMILSQYVLYEMPPATAALYIISTMAVVVVMVWAAVGQRMTVETTQVVIGPIALLGVTTALSRLAMFSGVKILGSLQTAVMAIGEIGVALALAYIVLGERLTPIQWVGVGVLTSSLLLVRPSDFKAKNGGMVNPASLLVHDMASIQFQRIAFHRAFGTQSQDNEFGVMGKLTTMELHSIQKMMGASSSAVDPFPLTKVTYDGFDVAGLLESTGADTILRPPKRKKKRESLEDEEY